MRLYAFELPTPTREGWTVVAVEELTHIVLVGAAVKEGADARATIREMLGPENVANTTWLPDPMAHPFSSAWIEALAHRDAPPVPEPLDPELARALHAEQHLCHRCVHDRICMVALATSQASAALPTITACQMFEETH